MTKSHVGMGCLVCPICLKEHTEQVLLDRRLEDSFENGTMYFVGWQMCDEHEAKREEYVALIEVSQHCTKLEDAKRTGNYVLLRRSAMHKVFNQPIRKGVPLLFVEQGVLDLLAGMQEEAVRDAPN